MKKLSFNIKEYSALACSLLLASQRSDGQIVHVDIDPDIVLDDNSYLLDIDANGIADFNFSKFTLNGFSYSFLACYSTVGFSGDPIFTTNAFIGSNPSVGNNRIYRLDSGYLINGNAAFYSDNHQSLAQKQREFTCVSYSHIIEPWPAVSEDDLLLGFRFNKDNCICYGWMRYSFSDTLEKLNIKEYAYNAECESGIYAGKLRSNEPPVTIIYYNGALTINITEAMLGSAILLYDISGRNIFNSTLFYLKTKFDVSNLPEGIYVVKVGDSDLMFTEEVGFY